MTTPKEGGDRAPQPEQEVLASANGYEAASGSREFPAEGPAPKASASPAVRVSRGVIGLLALVLIWHLFADRITPYTGAARVQLFYVSVAAQVSGYVTEVPIALNQTVKEGDVLVRINPRPYELAVANAEAQLALTGQNLRAGSAGIDSASGVLSVSRTRLDNAERNLERVREIQKKSPGAISQVDLDAYVARRDGARAEVARAQADVERAREQRGAVGEDNPSAQAARAALETARFNLEMATIHAPRDGVVADLRLTEGQFANVGQPLATLIVDKDVWIRAPMRENGLVFMKPGLEAEVVLDSAPGEVFQGRVESIGHGVSQGEAPRGELPDESRAESWFSAPQKFPVVVRLTEEVPSRLIRAGGKASVLVYTKDGWLLNAIAWFRIRVSSYVAYLN